MEIYIYFLIFWGNNEIEYILRKALRSKKYSQKTNKMINCCLYDDIEMAEKYNYGNQLNIIKYFCDEDERVPFICISNKFIENQKIFFLYNYSYQNMI